MKMQQQTFFSMFINTCHQLAEVGILAGTNHSQQILCNIPKAFTSSKNVTSVTVELLTWKSPGGHSHSMTDHILVSYNWKSSVTNSRVYPGADVGSDHQLIADSVRLKQRVSKRHSPVECFDTGKLDDPFVAYEYSAEIRCQLDPVIKVCRNSDSVNTEETWEEVAEDFNMTSREILGKRRGRPVKPWLSAETTKLVEERRELKPRKRETVMNTRH